MKNRINLLPPKDKDITEKIIYFILHYLRYILVITQICVIGVFFYRFKVDQQIIDLQDELQQKQEIVSVSKPIIEEARSIDEKIKEVKQIIINQNTKRTMLDYIFKRIPDKIRLYNLQITDNNLELSGLTEDSSVLKLFLNRLQKEKKFKTVNLKNIKKSSSGYDFVFNLSDFQQQSI